MKLEKQLLGKRILAKYDYSENKKELKIWFEDVHLKRLELKSWYVPSATRSSEIREEQFFPSIVSKETESVDHKLDLEREIADLEKTFEIVLEELMPIEQIVYKKSYEQKHSVCQMACDENTYIDYINHVKQSAITKICIVLGIAVSKERKSVK